MRHRNHRAVSRLVGCSLALHLVAGCQSVHTTAKPAPFVHQVKREQIVLHSDFSLVEHEHLINELCVQRDVLAGKLGQPSADVPIHVYLFAKETKYYEFLNVRFPEFPRRRAIFVDNGVKLAVYAHWGEHVAEDLRHEVTHGYLHATLPHLPLWLDEGLAEYFEVGPDQRGLNAAHLAQLNSLENFQPNLARLEQLTSAADMTQLDYAESWAWVYLLLESDEVDSHLLINYLTDLQQGATTNLSARLQKHLARPELALAEHLQRLR